MKTVHILSASALALLAAGLHAETYEGVQAPVSAMSRDAVYSDAVRTAAAADQNIPRGSRGAERFVAQADAAVVRADAVYANYAPDQNVSRGSRFNSTVVSTMPHPLAAQVQASKKAPTVAQ
ncbi:DUF4148 domain-containing protein [Variovorax rhizosphaerae]|uniref:DUF4148 domain-containing protein n=1 Tax=Variovorax rhizosphaerae TaxID=1836200 RepID=A0ABU8WD79_9BURK